ncbi:MAG: hypothetical protein IIT49_05115, partial [Clostridia bacterium]|nr:hypothetical protein [Clostridia bacterium]
MNKLSSYKRILSLVLSVLMIAAMLSVSADMTKIILVDGKPVLANAVNTFEKDSVNVKINLDSFEAVQVKVNGEVVTLNEENGFTLTETGVENTGKDSEDVADTDSETPSTDTSTDTSDVADSDTETVTSDTDSVTENTDSDTPDVA